MTRRRALTGPLLLRVLELYRQGDTLRQLAAATGVSYGAVHTAVTEAGLMRPRNIPQISDRCRDRIIQLYRDDVSVRGITAATGAHKSTIMRVVSKAGLPRRNLHALITRETP